MFKMKPKEKLKYISLRIDEHLYSQLFDIKRRNKKSLQTIIKEMIRFCLGGEK